MADRKKSVTVPSSKSVRSSISSTRPHTVGTFSRTRVLSTATSKDKIIPKLKSGLNTTAISENDTTISRQEGSMPDLEAQNLEFAYGKFLRGMLEECLMDEKISHEETQIDLQMAHLANRFKKTMDQLDKTNRRMKDIRFVVEQKRLIDLKSKDCSHIYELTEGSNAQQLLSDLSATEQSHLDELKTKNVDFGYDKESGHKQLLDAVNDAIEGLEEIKKHSNLNINKLKEYEKTQRSLDESEKNNFDIESLKSEFEAKFPRISEKLLKEASGKIARMIENDDEDDDEDND